MFTMDIDFCLTITLCGAFMSKETDDYPVTRLRSQWTKPEKRAHTFAHTVQEMQLTDWLVVTMMETHTHADPHRVRRPLHPLLD